MHGDAATANLGLRYNPAKIPRHVRLEPADTFVHGAVLGSGGTCASIPVVLAAVGRRLGYPIKLVAARSIMQSGHLFARWDDPESERFNIEATQTGLTCPPDFHYRGGLYKVSPEIERACCLLKSMTPREELACFLCERAHCWMEERFYRQAVESLAWATALAPSNLSFLETLKVTLKQWSDGLNRLRPPGFPPLSIAQSERRFPATLPFEVEKCILGLEAKENLLGDPEHDRNWWQPLCQGLTPHPRPLQALAEFTGRESRECVVSVDLAY